MIEDVCMSCMVEYGVWYSIGIEGQGVDVPLSPGGVMVGLAYLDGNTMVSCISPKILFSAHKLSKQTIELN